MNCFNDSTIKNILNIMKCDKDFVLNNYFFLCWPGILPYLILGIIAITVMIVLMVMLKFMQTLKKKKKWVRSHTPPQTLCMENVVQRP